MSEEVDGIEPEICRTAGFMVVKNRQKIAVAQSLGDGNTTVADVLVVPRSQVVSIKELKDED